MNKALAELVGRDVSRETIGLLELYSELLRSEASRQNLVSAATLDSLWQRHILDSAQLVRFEPFPGASWIDIGSGAGLPGIVIAALVSGPVLLVEPRRLRAEFLERCVAELGLEKRVSVAVAKAEKVSGSFDVITARAVANLDRLLGISTHPSTRKSLWVLPKGRSAQSELAEARRNWHCDATSVPSCTDPDSEILVLRNVKARGGR
jgi:16S rRNA (guanine527-N7)-methyltransferase